MMRVASAMASFANFNEEISPMNIPRHRGSVAAFTLLGFALLFLLAEPALAKHNDLYVDAAATYNGDGRRERPYWRITDAVVAARALRQDDADDKGKSQKDRDNEEKRIVIHVLPGPYIGRYGSPH